MEMSMYQDINDSVKAQQLKKNMYLDFGSSNTKQQKFQGVLGNHDLNMLKLGSPELEKMLIAPNGMMTTTPTPTQFIYPKYVTDEQEAYARGFVEALAELHQHGIGSGAPGESISQFKEPVTSTYSTLQPMTNTTLSSISGVSNTLSSNPNTLMNMNHHGPGLRRHHQPYVTSMLAQPTKQIPVSMSMPVSTAYGTVQVKEEPPASFIDQTVPLSPSTSFTDSQDDSSTGYDNNSTNTHLDRYDNMPVDLEEQEKIKLERKRARNRIAARKCRTRKLERISRLEEKVAELKSKNIELAQTASSLNDQVMQLKQQIMEHVKSGCQMMMPPMLMNMPGL